MKAAFVVALLGITFSALSTALPTKQSEFFWYTTDTGKVVPALLNGEPPLSEQIFAVEESVGFWHHLIGEEEGQLVTPGCSDCTSRFIRGAPLIIVAHGFAGVHTGHLGTRVLEKFAQRQEPVNIILIDWAKLVQSPNYLYAVSNVKKVGEYTAKLINFLVEQEIASVDNTHFVGHSLGAHLANYISEFMNGGKLQRAYGLDPAMMLFDTMDDSKRLSEHDGEFVMVMHTSMGVLGIGKKCGHADFFPNSGKHQPGCDDNLVGECSHFRCIDLLGESISNPSAFLACQCESWEEFESGSCSCEQQATMGWDTPLATRGSYYLRTNGNSPYGLK